VGGIGVFVLTGVAVGGIDVFVLTGVAVTLGVGVIVGVMPATSEYAPSPCAGDPVCNRKSPMLGFTKSGSA
jgi:hypothetical protein